VCSKETDKNNCRSVLELW